MWIFLLFACVESTTKPIIEPSNEGVVLKDNDNDGYLEDEDCDDENPAINSSQIEICDGVDQNCDGVIDEGVSSTFYIDSDNDGFGSAEDIIQGCDVIDGYVSNANDCDDENDQKYPGGIEVCDGLDNDCNAEIDDGVGTNYYVDLDNDGFGNPNQIEVHCELQEGLSEQAGDCDDSNNTVYPDAPEYCDAIDNDCNDTIDDGGTFLFFADADNDGFGSINDAQESCAQPEGYVSNSDDCDDFDTSISPVAPEYCDGIDNNCNGDIDTDAIDKNTFYADVDDDGFGDGNTAESHCTAPEGFVSNDVDCNDEDEGIYPTAVEICDGLDNNCDGTIDQDASDRERYFEDADGDGFGNGDESVLSCTALENYVLVDGDCNDDVTDDLAPFINPDMPEVCDEFDNNCDEIVDTDAIDRMVLYEDSDGDGFGISTSIVLSCNVIEGFSEDNQVFDCDDEDAEIYPTADEVCDEIDNDCDNLIDGNDDSVIGGTDMYLDYDNDGYGNPSMHIISCNNTEGYVNNAEDCDDLSDMTNPDAQEICDEKNNDCDEEIDEGVQSTFYIDYDNDGYGSSSPSSITQQGCSPDTGFADNNDDCSDNDSETYPDAQEICDDVDNNCNDEIDEGLIQFWYLDFDQDGFGDGQTFFEDCEAPSLFVGVAGDCDDSSELYNPDAELGCDGNDYNCDGDIDNDNDGDGFADITCGGDDCNDEQFTIMPDSNGLCAEGYSCDDVLNKNPSTAGENGVYVIDVDGFDFGNEPFEAYCDMTLEGGGWTLALKAAGTTFSYDSSYWTTDNTLNTNSLDESEVAAKFDTFNALSGSEILIKSEIGNHTRLALPTSTTLLNMFQGTTSVLTYISGSASMGELISNESWNYCGSKWRTNTFGYYQAKIRLGGWVTSIWGCGYGPDNAGQVTGAQLLGFGLLDNTWGSFTYNAKSFGYRDAHDYNTAGHPGQLESFGLLYIR